MAKANLWILSAASGTGKTSLVAALLKQDPSIEVSVSHTTRSPRVGEIEGQHYYFVSPEFFAQQVGESVFLEYAEVFGFKYGTSMREVEKRLATGIDVLLEIDWQGAEQVRRLMPDAKSIFIFPPSIGHLRQRLEGRGKDKLEVINRRLDEAKLEMSAAPTYDYWVINDDFEQATFALHAIIHAHRHEKGVMLKKNQAVFEALSNDP